MTLYEMNLILKIDVHEDKNDLDTPMEWIENIIEELKEDAGETATITGTGTIKEVKE